MNEKELEYMQYIKSERPQLQMTKIDFRFSDDPNHDFIYMNDDVVFKFSKYDWTVALLENEVNSISYIKNKVQMPLPNMKRLKKGAVEYKQIQGIPLIRHRLYMLTARQQENAARQIGLFLRDIHSIPMKSIKNSRIDESPVICTREEWLEEFEQIKRKVYPYCQAHTKSSIDLTFRALTDDGAFLKFQPAFIHACLTAKNIIFDEETGKIGGITGFELSGVGDPAYDLSTILNEYGEAFIKKIGNYYQISQQTMERARFYACADRFGWAKKVADMITTRDFSQLEFQLKEGEITPVGLARA